MYLSLKMRSARKYPSLTEAMPMTAPATTSEVQCLLFRILDTPVNDATAYPPKLNHGLLHPYSSCSMAASMKAVAVWPEGKELRELPSGRIRATEYLIPFTAAAITATENASETAIRPHEVLLS